jgi:hypothetical protein
MSRLQKLTALELGAPNVTDAGLKHLVGLKNLKSLYLADKISDDGLAKLQSALPGCTIRRQR